MTTICWTVIHHATASVARGAAKIAHSARRVIRPVVHNGGQVARHSATVAARPRVWFELVCKVVPAAVAGGGLLIPHPTDPLPGHEPPSLIQPAPPGTLPGLVPRPLPAGLTTDVPSWGWVVPPDIAPPPTYAPPTDTEVIANPSPPAPAVIEPSTAPLLLTALAGLLLARVAVRRSHPAGG